MPPLHVVKHHIRVIASTFYLASVGTLLAPFSRSWRSRLTQSWMASSRPFMPQETALSAFIDRSLDRVMVGPVAAGHANISEFELLTICSLVAQIRARRVFEIGTYDGRTTLAIARNIAHDGHVYTLNLPEDWQPKHPGKLGADVELASKVKSGERFLGTPEAARITQLWGDSATFDYLPYRAQMDVVFIDGAHSSEYAESDTRNALSLVRPEGGLIIWHDATRYGVAPFLRRYRKEFGVPLRIIRDTSIGIVARVGEGFVDAVEWTKPRRP
jgi:predicted O-methyltransferase YrrM